MRWFSFAVALLVALGILWIGLGYLLRPRAMTPSFGLPAPEAGQNTTWWLRLKGVRDVSSSVLVLVVTASDGGRMLGLVLLVLALVPLGDMSTVLAAGGRTGTALGVHGVAAVLMILAALPLLVGGA